MAIKRFAFDKDADGFQPHYGNSEKKLWPEGAYCPLSHRESRPQETKEHGTMVLWLEHVGLCLNDYEINGYDDSDFMMDIWNPEEQCVKTICYASTRGWTYPSYDSAADASPEVREAAGRWYAAQAAAARAVQRAEKVKELRKTRSAIRQCASEFGFASYRLSRLLRAVHPEKAPRVLKILTSNLRSDFRKKLRLQLVTWLLEKEPAYRSPFSFRQWEYV